MRRIGDVPGTSRAVHPAASTQSAVSRASSSSRLGPGRLAVAGPVDPDEFIPETWLPATAPPHVRWKTWNDRRQQLDTYVLPRIGGVRLRDLTPRHLNRLYAELLEEGRTRRTGGLSPTSVHIIHRTLRKALGDAVRWGLLPRNPTDEADPPPQRVIQAARRRSMRTWSADEVARFLDTIRDDPLYPLWHFAVTTGVRRSELLGLRWADLDLPTGTATIRHTLLETEDGYEVIDDQKTRTSGRTTHLDRRTREVLGRHRREQEEHYRHLGIADPRGLVSTDVNGRRLLPNRITKAFHRVVQAAGLPPLRFHDLRHPHATLLLEPGINPKVVSERLGHSSVAFTLDTYTHVMPGMQPQAAEHLAELILGPDDAADGADPDRQESAEERM